MTKLTKKERSQIEVLLDHAEIDLSYGGSGSYTRNEDGENFYDKKTGDYAREAIAKLRSILSLYD